MSKEQTTASHKTDNNALLYHIDIDKSILNTQELTAVINNIVSGFLAKREINYIHALRAHGLSWDAIASIAGRSRQNIDHLVNKYSVEEK